MDKVRVGSMKRLLEEEVINGKRCWAFERSVTGWLTVRCRVCAVTEGRRPSRRGCKSLPQEAYRGVRVTVFCTTSSLSSAQGETVRGQGAE